MKKIRILCAILAVLMLIGALSACDAKPKNVDEPYEDTSAVTADADTSSAALHCGWYYAEIPEGYEAEDETERVFNGPDDKTFNVYDHATYSDIPDAAAAAEAKAADSDLFTLGDDVAIGNYTFKTVDFVWDNDTPSQILYTDIAEGYYAEITLYNMTSDDPDAQVVLTSFKAADGDPLENQQAFYKEIYG